MSNPYIEEAEEAILHTYNRYQIVLDRGEGVHLYDENGKQVLSKRLKMDLDTQTAQLFIGVVSDEPEKLSYLDQVGVNYSMLRTKTIDLAVYDLPDTELGLDQLDVLLITDFNTQALTQEQTDAILEWVHRGGILLFGTGNRGEENG